MFTASRLNWTGNLLRGAMNFKNFRELKRTRIAIIATVAVAAAASVYYGVIFFWDGSSHGINDAISFLVTAPLIYGNLIYQTARLGALKRANLHRPAQGHELEKIYDDNAPALTILIPSFKEQPQVLRQTVLSAALAEYPRRRVVVLIDDPADDHPSRAASWRVIHELNRTLAEPARRFAAELDAYCRRCKSGKAKLDGEQLRLARLYGELGDWFEALAIEFASSDNDDCFAHSTAFFVDRILLASAQAHWARAAGLRSSPITAQVVAREYARLAELLRVEISGFERKTYINLSHAPNKAMNLNAYIGLLGGSFRRIDCPDGTTLAKCEPEHAELHVPDAQFLLTLDADSIIMPDYALRLVHVMQDDDRIAVAQTPYSAFPDAPSLLERTAGATTDIQYIAHQGSSYYDAAYWVGANALLRVSALREIRTYAKERGHVVSVFIQERTVIEDTGSTIDLIRKGWKIHNYPDRLAYSATPPDFGALIIQRRRWSNGGLLILPDLFRFWQASWRNRSRTIETLIRLHYLISPAAGSISVLTLLLYPFDFTFSVIWLPLAAAPYYFLYGRDLIRSGYKWADLLRVYALNLLLLPVNLAGVLLSIRQAVVGAKAPFGRTPKVKNRIAVPPLYSGFNALLCMVMVLGAAYEIVSGNYARALFPLFNGAFYAYGLVAFIGLRQSWADTLLMIRQRSTSGHSVAILPSPPRTGNGVADRRRVARGSSGSGAASDRRAFANQWTNGRRQSLRRKMFRSGSPAVDTVGVENGMKVGGRE